MLKAIIAAINRIGKTQTYMQGRVDGWNAAVKLWNETRYPQGDTTND